MQEIHFCWAKPEEWEMHKDNQWKIWQLCYLMTFLTPSLAIRAQIQNMTGSVKVDDYARLQNTNINTKTFFWIAKINFRLKVEEMNEAGYFGWFRQLKWFSIRRTCIFSSFGIWELHLFLLSSCKISGNFLQITSCWHMASA